MADILRFTTAGSVDDGKSTLIGRLLLETRSLYRDQIEAVTRESEGRGDPYLDLALFTDGLKAEREQKITIDVAYRYFSTPKRKFIIADCPGHLQYTRNMVTGASTAELAVILVDARKGLSTQSRRHAFISTLLGIPHLVVAVNKMDLVDYSEEIFQKICEDFRAFASRLEAKAISYLPISALHGDNVIDKSANMPWYKGGTFLHVLESVNTGASTNQIDFRLPIQYVIRPHQDFRGFAGRIASGRIQIGDEVVALPTGAGSKVTSIKVADRSVEEALPGDSVLVQLADEIDVSRGDLLVRKNNLPQKAQDLDAMLCWLGEVDLSTKQSYWLKLGTREVGATVARIDYLVDVDTLHRKEASLLGLNDIGRVQLRLKEPLYFDSYRKNREMGAFILIDPFTHNTVAGGMIRGRTPDIHRLVKPGAQRHLAEPTRLVSKSQRAQRHGHRGGIVWLTGLSGSGKSTIATRLEESLFGLNYHVILLDGDSVRQGLCGDLGFSEQDRRENNRRIAELAALLVKEGLIVICAFISPYRAERDLARQLAGDNAFWEVLVDCPLSTCQARDPKGLYAKVAQGTLVNFTGIDAPYERPVEPDVLLDTEALSVEECVLILEREIVGGTKICEN